MARLPWLWEIPRYIDELREVNLGYLIYCRQTFPLHNVANEIGALHNYILAGIFTLFGPNVFWPRLYVAVTSALTVVLVYYAGKRFADRMTGFLAAGLLLSNGMHILVSHMAWANCTTSFYFMLALISTMRAESQKSGRWLIISGLLWALALQTHFSVLIYFLTMLFYIIRPGFRRSTAIAAKDYLGAAIAFLIGYANMIFYNLTSGFESIHYIFWGKQYTLEQNPGLAVFGANLVKMLLELLRSVSATYQSHPYGWQYLTHPAFLISIILCGAGIYLAVRQKKTLPVWMIVGGFLVIPFMNRRYNFYLVTRYIMPVIICAILLMAYAGAAFLRKMGSLWWKRRQILIPAALFAFLIFMIQLIPFYKYCQTLTSTDLSNRLSLQVLQAVKKATLEQATREQKNLVLLDSHLTVGDEPYPILFKMSRIRYVVLPEAIAAHKQVTRSIFTKRIVEAGQLVAVLTDQTFNRLKTKVTIKKEQHFRQRAILHSSFPANQWEVIHVVSIANRNNEQ